MTSSHSHDFKIKIDGSPISDEVDRQLSLVAVEDSRNSPDVFTLSFMDPERRSPNYVLEKTRAKIGSAVSIQVVESGKGASKDLFKGEVTAVEASYSPEGTFTLIRGQDLSHRLFRGRKTRVWKNKSYSSIASEIAGEAGLELGTVDSTQPIYEHVSQFSVSDWQFLRALASECHREVAVGFGKLEFRKPTPSSDAPGVGSLTREGKPLQLMAGRDLKVFHAGITAADQVKEVQARGWDYKSRQAVLGTAPALTTSAQLGVTPAELANTFGSPVFVETGAPSGTKKHLENIAASLAEQIASGFAQLDGVVEPGNAEIKAGRAVSLGGAGKPFDGKYMITTSTHSWAPEHGYTTSFVCSGPLDRSLGAMTSNSNGSPNGSSPSIAKRIDGVVPAIVTDTKDPDKLNRVKVKFPWADENYVTDWARVVQLGAGGDRGLMVLPEPNDEVLVAFEQGDIRHPYVIGGLYNGVDKPYEGTVPMFDSNNGAINKRMFVSRSGHLIAFVESKDSQGVSIKTADKGYYIMLNQTKGEIRIVSDNRLSIKAAGDVAVEAGGNVEVQAKGKLTIEGQAGVKIDGGPSVVIKGAKLDLNPPGG